MGSAATFVGGHEALPQSNLGFQLRVHSLGISSFDLDPHYCPLPVTEEVQPDRNSCPAVLTAEWMVLDSNYSSVQKFSSCQEGATHANTRKQAWPDNSIS